MAVASSPGRSKARPSCLRRSQAGPVEAALGLVLSEIDENAKATFKSITLATMLRLIERQQAGSGSPRGTR